MRLASHRKPRTSRRWSTPVPRTRPASPLRRRSLACAWSISFLITASAHSKSPASSSPPPSWPRREKRSCCDSGDPLPGRGDLLLKLDEGTIGFEEAAFGLGELVSLHLLVVRRAGVADAQVALGALDLHADPGELPVCFLHLVQDAAPQLIQVLQPHRLLFIVAHATL